MNKCTWECGCQTIVDIQEGRARRIDTAFCPLHKAARQLAEALVLVLRDAEAEWGTSVCECLGEAPDDITPPGPCSYCIAREALRAAGVEE